jgi:uncharacterized protein
MQISFDPTKRDKAFAERGLDFADAALVFEGTTLEIGEKRIICYGQLAGRLVVIGYTLRGEVRHIFSMRKANDREQTRLAPYFEI